MTVETTPTPDVQADSVNAQTGSEEEAIAAFEAKHRATEPETDTEEAEPEHEPEDDADEEPSDGEPEDDDEPKGELVEVEFEGKTYEVAPELQKAILRQADYSRKMNEVGTKEKDYVQRIEKADKLIEGAEKFAEALAEVNIIDAQLKRFESVKWQELRATDPAEYAALAADMQSLRLSRDDAQRKAQSLDGEIANLRIESLKSKQTEMYETLKKELKGWGEDLGAKVTGYAIKAGYSKAEIIAVSDARTVIAWNKARLFDELQDAKKTLKSKAQDAPQVVKPGAKRAPRNDAVEALARFRKTSSPDDAVAAFEARARSR